MRKWCHLVHNCQYLLAFSQPIQIIISHFVSFPICWNKQFYDLDMCLLILLSDLIPAHSAWQKNPMNIIFTKKKKKSSKYVLFCTFLVINHICTLILNLPVQYQVTGPWEFPVTEHRWSEFISIKKHDKPYVKIILIQFIAVIKQWKTKFCTWAGQSSHQFFKLISPWNGQLCILCSTYQSELATTKRF